MVRSIAALLVKARQKLSQTVEQPPQPALARQVIHNAKRWCDVESVEEANHLSKEWDWTLVPGFTASKILLQN
ncbi:hypothetical protein ABBQ32_009784 [Trebouxia sp. C0010 RCD-2024]